MTNRLPVYDVRVDRPAAAGSHCKCAFRPVAGDECVAAVWGVRRDGPPPTCGQSSWLPDGGGDAEIRVSLGEADCALDRGLEAVLTGMRPGERREFCVGDGTVSTVFGEIELLEVHKRTVPAYFGWRSDDGRKLAEAVRHKDAGCKLYADGRYADAFHRFRECARAVLFVRDPAAVRDTRDRLYAAVCNNMAACQLQFGNFAHARCLCDKALSVDPDNVKALVRRCRASTELNMFDSALADARRVLTRQPDNAVAKRYLAVAARGVDAQNANYKCMVKKMFA